MNRQTFSIISAWLLVLFASPLVKAQSRVRGVTTGTDEFFIISSVDASKKQLVLKRPTEVTELMQVTDSTVCLDEQGKPLPFKELRAGDTVYVTCTRGRAGPPIATRIRRAPMTVGELHRRYLRGVAGP